MYVRLERFASKGRVTVLPVQVGVTTREVVLRVKSAKERRLALVKTLPALPTVAPASIQRDAAIRTLSVGKRSAASTVSAMRILPTDAVFSTRTVLRAWFAKRPRFAHVAKGIVRRRAVYVPSQDHGASAMKSAVAMACVSEMPVR